MTAVDVVRSPRRPFWGDVRFLLGILLIVVSVAGVWFVVAAARQTAPVYAAARTIVVGEPVTDSDLRVVDVALGRSGDAYLAADGLGADVVATRTIEEGELVPTSAVGDAAASRSTTVVLRSAVDVPTAIGAGTAVEVWSAPLLERGVYDEPRVLVADAVVVNVQREDSAMGAARAALELVIPRADVAAVLAATSDGAALSVVPVAGSTR